MTKPKPLILKQIEEMSPARVHLGDCWFDLERQVMAVAGMLRLFGDRITQDEDTAPHDDGLAGMAILSIDVADSLRRSFDATFDASKALTEELPKQRLQTARQAGAKTLPAVHTRNQKPRKKSSP